MNLKSTIIFRGTLNVTLSKLLNAHVQLSSVSVLPVLFIDFTMENLSSAFNPSVREKWAAIARHQGSIQGLRVLLRDPEWQAVASDPGYLWPLQDANALLSNH
ncbi:hypothetical protein ILYODFUR_002259 [Ilyodon furcidens]|uniref:Uncharacterized protein n=1 Tax=Ilyodon furcidens TaxID=33524 RepID=A0ABV0UR61_9TELE